MLFRLRALCSNHGCAALASLSLMLFLACATGAETGLGPGNNAATDASVSDGRAAPRRADSGTLDAHSEWNPDASKFGDASTADAGGETPTEAWAQRAYLKASNTGADDSFGASVSLSGDGSTLAIGADYENSSATGIGGNQADNGATDSGAVYIFVRAGSSWKQQAYIKASNAGRGDSFGARVSLSADGNTLAVGAPYEASTATGIGGNQADDSGTEVGAVYVYSRSAETWVQQAYVKASNAGAGDLFGSALSLSADGNTLAVGAWGEESTAKGIDGNQAGSGAPLSGAVYIFTRSALVWKQQAYVKASNTSASDSFGIAVALSSDGNTLAVGAHYEASSATGVNGDQADNTAPLSGAVYVFTRSGATWTQQAYVKASNTGAKDLFGETLALSGDGNTLAVGAEQESSAAVGIGGSQSNDSMEDSGAVYVYARSGATWAQQAYVKASNSSTKALFGRSVALSADGRSLAVGAPGEASSAVGIDGNQSNKSASESGAVYIFSLTGSAWTQEAYVKASNTGAKDVFGASVSMASEGRALCVGAHAESSSAKGVGGNQNDNSVAGAGAAYAFER